MFYIKKQFVDGSIKYHLDMDGSLERGLVTLCAALGSYYLILIPIIILAKAAYHVLMLKGLENIFTREEPGMASQKVKIKGDLAVDLIGSPILAVFVGLLLKSFMV